MIFVLTPETVWNSRVLQTRTVPKRLLSIGLSAYPRGGPAGLWLRAVFERSLPRYLIALLPFPMIVLARPELALGMSQAPLLMFGLVLLIETYVLSIGSPQKRRALIPAAEADRGRDLLHVRGKAALGRLAAARGIERGMLHLVVEQSGLVRVPVLTHLSVQVEGETPGYLALEADERAALARDIFTEGLDERTLHRISLASNTYHHVISLDAREVSAHARLSALAGR